MEFPTRFLFKESFYISDFFDYDFEIRAVFNDKDFKDRENILTKFIEFTYKLHKKKVYHIDYSPGNILVKKGAYGYTFSIIDVNRMKFIEFDDDLRMKNLAKLTNDIGDNEFIFLNLFLFARYLSCSLSAICSLGSRISIFILEILE